MDLWVLTSFDWTLRHSCSRQQHEPAPAVQILASVRLRGSQDRHPWWLGRQESMLRGHLDIRHRSFFVDATKDRGITACSKARPTRPVRCPTLLEVLSSTIPFDRGAMVVAIQPMCGSYSTHPKTCISQHTRIVLPGNRVKDGYVVHSPTRTLLLRAVACICYSRNVLQNRRAVG